MRRDGGLVEDDEVVGEWREGVEGAGKTIWVIAEFVDPVAGEDDGGGVFALGGGEAEVPEIAWWKAGRGCEWVASGCGEDDEGLAAGVGDVCEDAGVHGGLAVADEDDGAAGWVGGGRGDGEDPGGGVGAVFVEVAADEEA